MLCRVCACAFVRIRYRYRSVLSLLVGSQHDSIRVYCWMPAPAAQRPQLSIDISSPQGAQQQTRRPPLLLSIEGTERRTDGRTPDRYIDHTMHTMRAASIIRVISKVCMHIIPCGLRSICCALEPVGQSETTFHLLFLRYDTIRYDTRCYFNVRSKADISQLNLPHGPTTKKCKNRRKKLKSKKTDMLRSNSKQSGKSI